MSAAFAGVHTQLTNAPSSQRNTLPEPPPPPNPLHSIDKPNKTAVVTPIYIHKLSQFLSGYQWANYLIDGFTSGFKLGYLGPRVSASASNLTSCKQHPDIVRQKLNEELQAGRVKGPFSSPPLGNFRVSPIGVVPKKSPGQFRLIHHLSYPPGQSINDYIEPELASVSYCSFDDAVALLLSIGPGALFSKTDIDSAFRLIPIHPSDHHLLGIQFEDKFFYDTCLPMGASSSCAIFERFSSALQFISVTYLHIPHMVHILDDFLFMGPVNSPICQRSLDNFLRFCAQIGVPIKSDKTVTATPIITFMGLELDSILMEARLPADKLIKARTLLSSFVKSRKVTLKELQSLLGLLNFCCQVIVPGRGFLRRLIDLTLNVSKPHHHITLNKESRKDLRAWHLFLEHFNGKQVLTEQRWLSSDTLHLHTDASGALGFGAIFESHWFSGTWPEAWLAYDITFKEIFPISLSLEIWGQQLRNKCIVLHTDNEAAVHIINKQTCRVPVIMSLVRRIILASMKYNILLHAQHIPGKYNLLPDLLSRLQIAKFKERAPLMDQLPTTIPEYLFII